MGDLCWVVDVDFVWFWFCVVFWYVWGGGVVDCYCVGLWFWWYDLCDDGGWVDVFVRYYCWYWNGVLVVCVGVWGDFVVWCIVGVFGVEYFFGYGVVCWWWVGVIGFWGWVDVCVNYVLVGWSVWFKIGNGLLCYC